MPYEKVQMIGWTKMRHLAGKVPAKDAPAWIDIAADLSESDLRKALVVPDGGQGLPSGGGAGDSAAAISTPTSDTSSMIQFRVHDDQIEVIRAAIDKCKADLGTKHDAVALKAICGDYLAGLSKPGTAKVVDAGAST